MLNSFPTRRSSDLDNWFLHVNYWDSHTPYRAPDEFENPFKNEPLPSWLTEETLEKHKKMVGPHKPPEMNMFDDNTNPIYKRYPGHIDNMKDLHKMIDGYDCGIRYMDSHIALLFEALKSQGVFDDLAIIISADHGENMGELGIYGEHATADHATCNIPMIVKWPGCKKGHIDNGLHYNLDLLPTLADIFGIETESNLDGQSYAKAIFEGKDCGRESLILSQCAHVCQRSVRFDNWLYVRTYHDGFHLFPDEMLFDLSKDKYEQNNITDENTQICKEAVYRLNQWHDDMMKSMDYDVDPLWTVIKEGGPFHAKGTLARYCKRLIDTGRGYAVPELKKRHPKEFK